MEGIIEGQNIRRIREFLGLKQEALADLMGPGWNQQKISLLEQKESIPQDVLSQVCAALQIPPDLITNMDEKQAFRLLHTLKPDSSGDGHPQWKLPFNPLEKIVELYERLIAEKDRQLSQK